MLPPSSHSLEIMTTVTPVSQVEAYRDITDTRSYTTMGDLLVALPIEVHRGARWVGIYKHVCPSHADPIGANEPMEEEKAPAA